MIKRLLGAGSLPQWLGRGFRPDAVSILMYHAVVDRPLAVEDWCFLDLDRFRWQMRYLREHCEVVPLSALPLAGGARKPRVVITFDDGFENNYTVARPVLEELGLPATIFLATDLIGSDDTVWFCRVNQALARTTRLELRRDGLTCDLSNPAAKAAANVAIQRWLKTFPHAELLARLQDLLSELDQDPAPPVPRQSAYRMLDLDQIAAMTSGGLVEFGAHTRSHAILGLLPDADREAEIADSVAAVARWTGKPCTLFSYPNGSAGDFGAQDLSTLARLGVRLAVSTLKGANSPDANPLMLRRYGVGAAASPSEFKLLACHLG